MPTDFSSLRESVNHPLSTEELDSLLSTFSKERKRLICPNCNQQGHLRRHGSTKSDPPHLLFLCASCGKCFQAASMKHIIHDSCQEQSQIQAPTDMEQTRSFQENNNTHTPTTHSSQNDLQTLLDTIQRLTQELQQARAEINSLRSQTDKLQQQLLQQTQTADPFPSLIQQPPCRNPEATTQMSNIESAPWHEPAKIQRIKDNLFTSRNQRRLQQQEAAARLLQPPSTNQGFKYIYLPTKARVPIGQIRSRLRKLNINNNRIIDIHYPDRNIVALLIHNDYEDELRQQLQRFKVTIKEGFNPCDPQVLRDLKYADRTPAEREDLVFMHHCNHIERALQYIRAQSNLPLPDIFIQRAGSANDFYKKLYQHEQ
ncbi:hypothetical protein G6F62_009641 [Rhizopus arrhizus]|uniref:Uncharacterized protein n=1 Tax=Rhizopus oryzae TaxID=64495 RepID=A0A9P7BLX4_RHIOR|nr:hypothetical protein G6F23_010243 [Rhizopus arrhizus]KAG0764770.1 hypothetical protein G6F24_004950 [Rhizopus arrhizus]KAG0781392.1 hypothetical protein G6F22_009594 [Rhizopus arrhizus]KAG0781557.1 hypothetical protein G6F21_011590 [Rhizopus arrhizus]KAG0815039.1 hypothetical protein G6F20_004307 [Rhizopus arrhizus]